MATKSNTDETVTQPVAVFDMHLDDFLNAELARTHLFESISAFGRRCVRKGVIKQPEAAWRQQYDAFMREIPE